MLRRAWIAALLVTSLGCATGAPVGGHSSALRYRSFSPTALPRSIPQAEAPNAQAVARAPVLRGGREKAIELARGLVGKSKILLAGKHYPDDCTGLVKGVFDQLGMDLAGEAQRGDNGVTAIFRFASAHGRIFEGGRPVAGDLVFFRETYDLNRDGRVNDGLTHVGLVEEVGEDGTVLVIHRVNRGVVRYRMNLAHRAAHLDPETGAAINDYLRLPGPLHKDVLTGQLFAAYATVLPIESRLASR